MADCLPFVPPDADNNTHPRGPDISPAPPRRVRFLRGIGGVFGCRGEVGGCLPFRYGGVSRRHYHVTASLRHVTIS